MVKQSRITKKERNNILNINSLMIDATLDDDYQEVSNLQILLNEVVGDVMCRLLEEDYDDLTSRLKNKRK